MYTVTLDVMSKLISILFSMLILNVLKEGGYDIY